MTDGVVLTSLVSSWRECRIDGPLVCGMHAYEGAVSMVAGAIAEMTEAGEEVPRPLSGRGFSGAPGCELSLGYVSVSQTRPRTGASVSRPASLVADVSMASGSIVFAWRGVESAGGA